MSNLVYFILYFNQKVDSKVCACDQIHDYPSAMIVKIASAILIRTEGIS